MLSPEARSVDLQAWCGLQKQIAQCRDCVSRWPTEVIRPLSVGEIPDPPRHVDVLFVGVGPTPQEGKFHGEHFYSTTGDLLRRGLFVLLEEKCAVDLTTLSLADGNRAFH